MMICAVGITTAVAAAGLKKYCPEISVMAAIAGGIIILVSVLSKISPLIGEINELISLSGLDPQYAEILLKTIGVCMIGKFTSEFCNDNGYSSLGSKVEFASKISVILISLPLYQTILSTALKLIQ